jgi:hypothetical protein
MAGNVENTTLDALAIRDTNTLNGTVADLRGLQLKTIIVENGLDQTVTIQVQGASTLAFTKSFDVGNSFDVTATTNTFETVGSYLPFMRVTATCASSPTTGSVTVIFINTD